MHLEICAANQDNQASFPSQVRVRVRWVNILPLLSLPLLLPPAASPPRSPRAVVIDDCLRWMMAFSTLLFIVWLRKVNRQTMLHTLRRLLHWGVATPKSMQL